MDPEPNPIQSTRDLVARQDRLEERIAELSRQVQVLERRLAAPTEGFVSAAGMVAPPPLPTAVAVVPEPAVAGGPRPSLESRLGSQVFNRVGIVALLIGVTWFLKLAVDNEWIGPTARILIGLVAGSAIVLWSERFRRKGFPAFSYSLKAIGTGVLYLALWAAFQLYHLLPAAAVLPAMLLVTAWNAWTAWAQDAELLAAYALAGGMSTPLLLRTGGNHELFLFTYLLSIDAACVALARLKGWPRLLPGALLSTTAYFIGWYSGFYAPGELTLTAVFAVLFAAVFASVPFGLGDARGEVARPRVNGILEDIVLPVGAAAFAALALYSVLEDAGHHDLLPWMMLAMSAVYLVLMRLPQRQLASAIHLSLAVVFLTIAIPLKASGPWIVLAWLTEGTALLWVATRGSQPIAGRTSGRLTLVLLASASLALGFVGVFYELFFAGLFANNVRQAFWNRGFGTAVTGLAAFAASLLLTRSGELRTQARSARLVDGMAAALAIGFNVVGVVAGVVQIGLLFRGDLTNTDATLQRALAISAFLMLYGGALLTAGFWRRSALVRWQALVLLVFSVAKTFLYDMRNLSSGYRVLSFLGLGVLLMAVSFAYQKDWLALREPPGATTPQRSGAE